MAKRTKPVSGRDYPGTWGEFLAWFPDNQACLAYLESLRWADGFDCPQCRQRQEPYRASRGRLICRSCRHQTSVTAGTIFDKTRTPLTSWFAAVWHMTAQKYGTSALGLQRVLGLGSYQTAWTMLHRLRRAMARPDRDGLSGIVEVDELFLAGPVRITPAWRGRYPSMSFDELREMTSMVAVAVEVRDPKGFGRVHMRRIDKASQDDLLPFVLDAVELGAIVRTDGSHSYRSLEAHGYQHDRRVHLDSPDPAHVSMPGVNRISSLLQRWLMGTHQGSVRPQQLDYYLDEYAFRFNRRHSRSRGQLFYRLLQQATARSPVTYEDIAGGTIEHNM